MRFSPASLFRRPVTLGSPGRLLALIAAAVLLYTLAGAWIAATWQHRAGQPLTAAGFGYGPLIAALDATGRYQVSDVHYPGIAFSAHRLPVVPGLLMAFRGIVGDDLARIGLAKALLFNVCLGAGLWLVLLRLSRPTVGSLAILLVPLAMPAWHLTVFEISVEEAYLIPLLALLMSLLWFGVGPARRPAGAVTAAVLVCMLLPWIKHSMPYWALAAPVLLGLRTRSWKIGGLGVILVAASLAALATFTLHVSGRFTVKSSWEGWNLYKGNNPATRETYPHYSLDVLDYTGHVQADRPLRDEWDHNAYFSAKAWDYIRTAPRDFLGNCLRKAWVFFFEIRRTGRSMGQTDDASMLRQIQSGSLLLFRAAFWLAVALALRGAFHRRSAASVRIVPLGFLGLIVLYAGFHVIGFAYERHVMPLVLPTVLFLAWHFGGGADHDAPAGTIPCSRTS